MTGIQNKGRKKKKLRCSRKKLIFISGRFRYRNSEAEFFYINITVVSLRYLSQSLKQNKAQKIRSLLRRHNTVFVTISKCNKTDTQSSNKLTNTLNVA
jgi:hypothetical protein